MLSAPLLPIPELLVLALMVAFAAAPLNVISLDAYRRRKAGASAIVALSAAETRTFRHPATRLSSADQWQRLAFAIGEGSRRAAMAKACQETARTELAAIEFSFLHLEKELAAVMPSRLPRASARQQPVPATRLAEARAA